VRQLYLTGGEPFLLADIDRIVEACTAALPTTVLTNGMLFRGRRRELLDRLSRDHLTLQISLDSAEAPLHDLHRGEGSHARAVAGLRTARELGFRVRLAATLDAGQHEEERALHRFCDEQDIEPHDRVIRRVAHQGVADHGVEVSRASLVPEVCVTATGVYWHPVAAADPSMLVRRDPFPLRETIADIGAEFAEHRRRAGAMAATFPCA
jgi:molybdenum cofactor biosynthesis enzyme MoaA